MTLEQIQSINTSGKQVLIIGRPSSGKTWLSNCLCPTNHKVIHTDNYLEFTKPIQKIIEDEVGIRRYYNAGSIIEGMLGYPLLLRGQEDQSYIPDIVIEVEISAGKQREIYLKERDASKLQLLKRFQIKCMGILDQYYKLVPEADMPLWYTFKNEWDVIEKQD